jgi:hypothetical protein
MNRRVSVIFAAGRTPERDESPCIIDFRRRGVQLNAPALKNDDLQRSSLNAPTLKNDESQRSTS